MPVFVLGKRFRGLVAIQPRHTLETMIPPVARIRAEERPLREYFGAEYEQHCVRAWRPAPGIY